MTELERTAVADSDGHLELHRIPTGDYDMSAWGDVDAGARDSTQ